MSLLVLDGLTKCFGSLVVTNQVNLCIEAGERHAVIGPNGAGKTSLINQIGGQLRPSSGQIRFKGEDIIGLPPEALCRRGIARTFQRNNLFPTLTATENVLLALQIKQGKPFNFISQVSRLGPLHDAAAAILERVGLAAEARVPGRLLSYGAQRQLEIAVALAGEPDLLLLDEPTSGMSPAETERMAGLIDSLPRRLTVIMVEHDMQLVFALANRITVLHYGEVLATGTSEQIRGDPRVREVYLGETPA
jgi:branched-chain amino acid transport system ATP-binding protein